MKYKKVNFKIILIINILIMIFHYSIVFASNEKKNINILIINSHDMENDIDKGIEAGVMRVLNKMPQYSAKISTEYLNYDEKKSDEYIQKYIDLLEYKYQDDNIDYIYAIDNDALDFVKKLTTMKDSKFYKTPTLFSGVTYEKALEYEEVEYIKGLYTGDLVRDILYVIYGLDNSLEQINVVISDDEKSNEIKKRINEAMPHINSNNIEVNIIQSTYIDEIEEKIKNISIKDNNAVIISGEFLDSNEVMVDYTDTINLIKKYINGPIYSTSEEYVGKGILAASIDSREMQGMYVIESIIRLEENREAYSTMSTARRIIDYKAIYEYDIDIDLIASEMTVINKKPYELLIPKNYINMIKITIVILLLSIILGIYITAKAFIDKNKVKREKEIMEEREKIRVDFIAVLSHEIRTPLNIIINSTNLITKNIKDEKYVKEKIGGINNNSYRLLKLTNNILDTIKLDAGLLNLNFQCENIVEVIEDVFQAVVPYGNKKNIDITFDTEEEEIYLILDKNRIQRAILNLLSNSIKFTNENGYIQCFIKLKDNNVIIEIKDSGIGIEREKIEDIFKKFSILSPTMTRQTEGGGLGLYIVKNIIEMHKGNIVFKSIPSKGTVVNITLPINSEIKESEVIVSSLASVEQLTAIEMSDLINL